MVCAIVLLGSLFSGCFESSTPQNGTETHFLKYCDTTCEGHLQCLSGLCTTHCTESESCSVLSEHAVCTEAGLGGEAEPICDIACDTEADCHKVSPRLGCRDGFCREPKLDSKEPSGEDAGRLEDNPPDSSGRSTDEDAGMIADSVYLCPDDLEVTDDPMNVLYQEINGDELTLVVQCCGSCQQQDFSLCYEDFGPWSSSDPVRVTTRLINNQNSYMCDEGLETNLHFELTPIAQTYRESISAEGGLVETSHGLYLFKQLSCPDRQAYADILSSQVLFRADKQCTGPSDCQIVNPSIACYDECLGVAVSLQGSESWGTE
ncbi:MAG: hypothetical protein JXA30_20545 [Deltaproteobacteria bacterium]|nr:hypothetical protein [Deltaproteobacteria bacterium]